MKKEHPILFSGQMVEAILDGCKTQTRRVIKNIPPDAHKIWHDGGEWIVENKEGNVWNGKLKCPFGEVGDNLWVRETWGEFSGIEPKIEYVYRADKIYDTETKEHLSGNKWRPSIFMPRAASRILLEVTAIRAERLNDITEEDSYDEGFEWVGHGDISPTFQFKQIWEKINGAESWQANPFVWVVSFKKV